MGPGGTRWGQVGPGGNPVAPVLTRWGAEGHSADGQKMGAGPAGGQQMGAGPAGGQ